MSRPPLLPLCLAGLALLVGACSSEPGSLRLTTGSADSDDGIGVTSEGGSETHASTDGEAEEGGFICDFGGGPNEPGWQYCPHDAFVIEGARDGLVRVGDLDGDSMPDLAVLVENQSGQGLELRLNDADEAQAFSQVVALPIGSGAPLLTFELGDVDADGALDIVGLGSDGVYLWRNEGANAFQAGAPITLSEAPGLTRFELLDVNADGFVDIFFPEDAGALMLGDGQGQFALHQNFAGEGCTLTGTVWSDVNADGRLDHLVFELCEEADAGGHLTIWTSDEDGVFLAGTAQTLPAHSEQPSYADLDGDGASDLIVEDEDGNFFICLGLGEGLFDEPISFFPSYVDGVRPLRLDEDELIDLWTSSGSEVILLTSHGDLAFQECRLDTNEADPRAIADLNGDGMDDIVIGHSLAVSDDQPLGLAIYTRE